MKRFLLSISALLLFTTFILYAEKNDTPLPTFHTLSVSPHYGQMHYNINLYHLQDPDFDWSFLLSYTSDGFRPFTYSGQVGENWSLQAGGSITREIIGIADDEYTPQSDFNSSKRRGLLVALRELPIQDVSSSSLFETVPSWLKDSGEVDLQSDIYTFSCNGYSGRFIIGLDGKAHILSGDFVSVDLSGMTTQVKDNDGFREIFIHPDVSTISFTTLDGYRYVFGGNIDALGYSFSKLGNAVSSDDEPLYPKADITQWLLTSVIASNGRRMDFHYKPIGTEMDNNCTQYAYSFTSDIEKRNEYYNMVREDFYLSDTLNLISVLDKQDSKFWLTAGYRVFEKIPLLDSITTSDHSFSARFFYETLPNQICDNGSVYWNDNRNREYCESYWTANRHFLSRIMVRSATSLLSQWNLSYHQLSVSPVTRQYLQSVTHDSGIQYSFDYNITQPSAAIDRFDSIDMVGYKISNPTFGTLSRITDPLGCVTTLEFQPCKYDSIRIFKQEGTSIRSTIQAYDKRDLVHPIAITAIRKTASDGKLLSSKQYEYGSYTDMVARAETFSWNDGPVVEPSLPISNENYGIVNIDFAIDISAERANSWSKQRHYAICPYFTPSGSNASPIEFPMVTEYIYDSNNQLLYRNEYSFDRTEDNAVTHRQSNSNDFHRILGAYSYLSQEYRRNRLSVKQEYDDSGTLRRKTINRYCPIDILSDNADHTYHTPCTTPWRTEYTGGVAYKVFFTETRMAEQQINHYEENGTHTSRTTYEYDAKHRLTRTGVWQGDTETFTRYRYPDDICAVSFRGNDQYVQGYCGLVRTHRIATPVETVQGISRNGQSFITAGGIAMYYAHNWDSSYSDTVVDPDLPDMPPAFYAAESTPPVSLPLYFAPCSTWSLNLSDPVPVNDYVGLSVQNGQLRYDRRYETAATCTYDSRLRLTSTTPVGQPTTSYTWDDKGLNIISETTGTLTTRYTHIPYVGISSVTSPQGITTYYTYDTLGNVTEVYQYQNGQKVILQAFKYHYQSQQ